MFNTPSFPYDFKWNVILDTVTTLYRPYIRTIDCEEWDHDTAAVPTWASSPIYIVRNNCWGNDTTPGGRLWPTGAYDYKPIWCPPGSNMLMQNAPQLLFEQASASVADSNYSAAEAGFKQLIAGYPDDSYSLASFKELFALNPALYDSGYHELETYCDSLAANPGDSLLGKMAEWFSIRCKIQNSEFQQAVDGLDSILANPGTYADSIFALIDLCEVFSEMEETPGLKSSLATRNQHVIPASKQEFLNKRTEWIDLLLKANVVSANDSPAPLVRSDTNSTLEIRSVYPNPCEDQFTLDYELFREGLVEISIVNISGQEVASLNPGKKAAGIYRETFTLPSARNGLLFLIIRLDGVVVASEKVICF
jgi:hypothetical protein